MKVKAEIKDQKQIEIVVKPISIELRQMMEDQRRRDKIYKRNPRRCPNFCGHF